MKVTMTDFARRQVRETAKYIQQVFGKRYRDKFLEDVKETRLLLANNPHLGPVEPLLSDSPSGYRSIVIAKLNKMIYRILDESIEIADFWDVRQAPDTLASRVK